jgi:hypothetical protein
MLTPNASRPSVPEGYGIAAADEGLGLLPWSWAEERLVGRHIWWLATTKANGAPHLIPVWAVWLGDGVAFSTDEKSQKAHNIGRDPRVSITPERGTQSVIIEGVVEHLPADRKADYNAAYQETWDLDVSTMESPVWIIRPKKVFAFIDEDNGFPLNATRWTFD